MYQEVIKNKKAFTLVELIVTITILVILVTIWFISFQWYTKDARDWNRVAALKNIEAWLWIYYTSNFKYPKPDILTWQTKLQTWALSISWTIVEYSYLWEIWNNLSKDLQISSTPKDPLTWNNYLYATTLKWKSYQTSSILENIVSYKKELVTNVYAWSNYIAKVEWNHKIEVIQKIDWKWKFITIVPSLIFDVKWSNVLNNTWTLSIVNNKSNLPYWKNINTQTSEKLIKELRWNDIATTVCLQIPEWITLDWSWVLNDWWAKNKNWTNWNKYSTWVILASLWVVDGVSWSISYEKLTSILNWWDSWNIIDKPSYNQEPEVLASYDIWNSLRFNGSNAYLTRTPTVVWNRQKWTWSGWIKRSYIWSSPTALFSSRLDDNNRTMIYLQSDQLIFQNIIGWTAVANPITNGVFRDPSTWYSVVVSYDSTSLNQLDRVKIWVNNVLQQTTWTLPWPGDNSFFNYNSQHSLWRAEYSTPTAYMNGYISDSYLIDWQALDPKSFWQFDPNGRWIPKSYTWSYWTNGFHLDFSNSWSLWLDTSEKKYSLPIRSWITISNLNTPDQAFDWNIYPWNWNWQTASTSWIWQLSWYVGKQHSSPKTITAFRAFWPIDVNFRFVSGSTSVTMKLQWSNNNSSWVDLYTNNSVSAPITVTWGIDTSNPYLYHRLLVTENWAYTSSHAISIWELELYESWSFGINNWTSKNFNTYDQMIDSPTNNFATLNPIYASSYSPTIWTFSNGNLWFLWSTSYVWSAVSTISVNKWKWYFEVTWFQGTDGTDIWISSSNKYSDMLSYWTAGLKRKYNSTSAYWSSASSTDIIWVLFDADVGNLTYYKNESSMWLAFSWILVSDYFMVISDPANSRVNGWIVNFWQWWQAWLKYCADAWWYFKYCPPTWFKALSTRNFPAYSIENPKQYFDVLAWNWANSQTNWITDMWSSKTWLNFSPDLVWLKARNEWTFWHLIRDSVRSWNLLLPLTDPQYTSAWSTLTSWYIKSLDSNWFTLWRWNGSVTPWRNVDESWYNYVAWNWKAWWTTTTNNDWTIQSQVSANRNSGFSVVKFNTIANMANTIGHGLGSIPSFMIVRYTGTTGNWVVYHKSLSSTSYLLLESTAGSLTSTNVWNSAPTSTLFSIGTQWGVSTSAIAYVWSEVPWYSKFWSYTWNGSSDWTFVYTWFKPKYIMIKRFDSGATGYGWMIYDTIRGPYNTITNYIMPDSSLKEQTDGNIDIVSNGFKFRSNGPAQNALNATYIYAAFAELPFK